MRPIAKIMRSLAARHEQRPEKTAGRCTSIKSLAHTLSCVTVTAILGGIAVQANALENGKPDNGYQNVGVLGFVGNLPQYPDEPVGICSGFVISDRAFVTAAHCITQVERIAQSWAVTLEPGSPDSPIVSPGILNLATFNLHEFPILGETYTAASFQLHPQFDPDTLENDVAVLEFPAGTFDKQPVQLARPSFLRKLKRLGILKQIPIGVVGYGADQSLGGFDFSIPGYRNRGFSAIETVSRTRMTLGPTPVLDANVLPGDSGSPQFVLGRVVSLTSFSDHQRLDTHAVRRFLAPYVSH